MSRILSVAEKPSVAKELARIIGRETHVPSRSMHSPYNRIFDIPSCTFMGKPASMMMTSVTGHMMEVDYQGMYRNWNCPLLDLFDAPIAKQVKHDSMPIERNLVELARQCNVLLLWLDCDLEGENIAFEVISVCLKANPRMDVYRARFSALIDRDIHRAMQYPERPNRNMSDAGDARQEIDLRTGAVQDISKNPELQKQYNIQYGR